MATHALSAGDRRSSPGNTPDFSTPSRRALLGALAATPLLAASAPGANIGADQQGSTPMNMFTSIARSSTTAAEKAWDRAWREFQSTTAQRDAFYEGVMAPLNTRYPAHPGFEPVRVGTSRGTGEPLMHTFYPQDLELEGWHPYLENAGWQQARNRWLSYTRERDAFQAATNYDALEEQADELTSVAADAQHDMLCTPAPHLEALRRKLEIAFGEDGPDLTSDGALRASILSDAALLV